MSLHLSVQSVVAGDIKHEKRVRGRERNVGRQSGSKGTKTMSAADVDYYEVGERKAKSKVETF